MTALLSSTYFGPIEWYHKMVMHREAVIEAHDNYQKQTYRNRCVIATTQGTQVLTVPVERQAGNRVRISDHGNWRHLHWQALQAAYGMSPFFDYYADDLRPFFEKRWDYLFDYNMEITATMLRLLGINAEVTLTHDPVSLSCDDLGDSDIRYYQTFQRRHGFIPGMSILDLLCNEGPESVLKLSASF